MPTPSVSQVRGWELNFTYMTILLSWGLRPLALGGAAEGTLVPHFAVRAWRMLVLALVLVHGFVLTVLVLRAEVLRRTNVALVHYLTMRAGIALFAVALAFATVAEGCRSANTTLLLPHIVRTLDCAVAVARRTLTPATTVITLGPNRAPTARVPAPIMLAPILSFVLRDILSDLGQDAGVEGLFAGALVVFEELCLLHCLLHL